MARPLAGASLLALGFVAAALAHTPEPGVDVRDVGLTSPRGERVPALWVTASEPRGDGEPGSKPRRPASDRPTALLAHGITASKETMRPIAEALARAGFVCCAIDLPSHGASTTPLTADAVRDAFAAGALALAREASADGETTSAGDQDPADQAPSEEGRPPRVDVLVGHSFGAGTGGMALGRDVLAAGLFVAVGSKPGGGALKADRVLLLSGRFEELISPDELRAHAAALGPKVQVEIAPHSDHALEPFDPAVMEAVVRAARSLVDPRPGTGTRAPAGPVAQALPKRILGQALLFGLAALGIFFLPRVDSRASAVCVGLCGGALVALAAVLGFHGVAFYLAPTGPRPLSVILLAALALVVSVAVGRGLRRVPQLARHEAPATSLLLFVLASLLTAGVSLGGQRFPALIFGLLTVLLAAGGVVGLLVRRRTGSDLAAHAASAAVVGYVPGVWFGALVIRTLLAHEPW